MTDKNEENVEEVESEEEVEDSTDDRLSKLEAELKQERGIRKRAETKLKKIQDASEEEAPVKKEEKKEELDLTQIGYIESKGFESDEELDYVKDVIKRTGETDVRVILKDEYHLHKLKKIQDNKASLEATPEGTKTSKQTSSRDSVEYYLAKGTYPKDNPELKQKVVNAKIARQRSKAKFYNS